MVSDIGEYQVGEEHKIKLWGNPFLRVSTPKNGRIGMFFQPKSQILSLTSFKMWKRKIKRWRSKLRDWFDNSF